MAPMPLDFLRISTVLPASAARVYAAWLDADEHSRMTGGKATVDPTVGGLHSAWDGYIGGKTLELEPDARIVQSWRTSQFPASHAHSRLEVRLRDVPGGCEITLVHSEIPEGQGERYESGWQGHYFNPMTEYFRAAPEMPRGAAPRKKGKTAVKAKVAAKTPAKKVAKKAAKKKPAVRARKVAKKTAARVTRKAAPKKKASKKKASKKASKKAKKKTASPKRRKR